MFGTKCIRNGVIFWLAPDVECLAETSFPHNEGNVWRETPLEFDRQPSECESEELIELAGKGCYWSYGKGRTGEEYIKHLMEVGHGSVLEHVNITLGFKGISRALSHEFARHRHLSISQLSQRYSDLVEFVIPPALIADHESAFMESCLIARQTYIILLAALPNNKAGREVARAVLPNATATRMIVTGNLRAWRDFIIKRGAKGADAEMVRLAGEVLTIMKLVAPTVFGDITKNSEGYLESKYGCI